jgi:hypothetical protein
VMLVVWWARRGPSGCHGHTMGARGAGAGPALVPRGVCVVHGVKREKKKPGGVPYTVVRKTYFGSIHDLQTGLQSGQHRHVWCAAAACADAWEATPDAGTVPTPRLAPRHCVLRVHPLSAHSMPPMQHLPGRSTSL